MDLQKAKKLREEAWAARRDGRLPEAQQKLRAVVTHLRSAGLRRELAATLGQLAHVEDDLKNPDTAFELREEAAAVARQSGDDMALAHAVRHLGDSNRHAGRASEAEACYLEAIEIYRKTKPAPKSQLANTLRPFAILKEDAGDLTAATALWQETQNLYRAIHLREGVDECSEHLIRLQANG